MSNPFIRIDLYDTPQQFDAMTLDRTGGWGMMSQRQEMKIDSVGLTGLRTLIEPAGYGFYVFLINKSKKFATALKKNGLLQTYEDAQAGNTEFKSYMIEQLDPGRKILDSDNNKVYMICVTMYDWGKLPFNAGSTELLSPDLAEAITNITYGVMSGGKKRRKKSYKRKSNKRSRKTRRYKK
jgi:hypothetical protein